MLPADDIAAHITDQRCPADEASAPRHLPGRPLQASFVPRPPPSGSWPGLSRSFTVHPGGPPVEPAPADLHTQQLQCPVAAAAAAAAAAAQFAAAACLTTLFHYSDGQWRGWRGWVGAAGKVCVVPVVPRCASTGQSAALVSASCCCWRCCWCSCLSKY